MQRAEFDRFAEAYIADHTENIKITGEDIEYFARYKVEEIRRLWTKRGYRPPATALDFGSGVGASLPHLRSMFPETALTAYDISARSVDIARSRFGDAIDYVVGDSLDALGDRRFDLIFTSCVFHHIAKAEHVGLFTQLRERLSTDGALVVFEHNPVNPVTRYIVATCPFDENAVLIPAPRLMRRLEAAGFMRTEIRYTGFFPAALSGLRPFEPALAFLPVGAQYYVVARN